MVASESHRDNNANRASTVIAVGQKKGAKSMGKRGPAPTTGAGTTIGVRCQDEFLTAVDAWRNGQDVPPSRASALRRLAEEGLRILSRGRKGTADDDLDIARRIGFTLEQLDRGLLKGEEKKRAQASKRAIAGGGRRAKSAK